MDSEAPQLLEGFHSYLKSDSYRSPTSSPVPEPSGFANGCSGLLDADATNVIEFVHHLSLCGLEVPQAVAEQLWGNLKVMIRVRTFESSHWSYYGAVRVGMH
eukprot:6331364-Pyramimonas_sp.AAC.3